MQPAYSAPVRIPLPLPPLQRRLRRQAETLVAFGSRLGPLARRKVVRRRPVETADVATALRAAFDSLGSTYVKFGQVIASSPGAFGVEAATAFRTLLDEGVPVAYADVRHTVETALGRRLDEVFASFSVEPIAAASMAVVHRAQLHDGTTVAVKVLRPGMAERVAVDLDIMQPLLKRLGLLGVDVAGGLYRYLSGFRAQVAEELDLRNEARTMTYMRGLAEAAGLHSLVIPAPVDGLVARDVLVMEFLDGVPIDDFDAVAELGLDPQPLVRDLLDFWFITGLRDGVFHGDIHAGNLMLLRDGRLGLIDWGIVGVLDDRTHHFFRRWVQAMLGDTEAFAEVAEFMEELMPFIGEGTQMLEDANAEMSLLLNRPFGDVDLNQTLREHMGPPDAQLSTAERRERAQRLKRQRQFERQALRSGLADSDFGQANFLLFKQLIYFDRYGKLYLADEPLLRNRDLLLELAAGPRGGAASPSAAQLLEEA